MFIIFFLTTAFEMATSRDVNKNSSHQLKFSKKSDSKWLYSVGNKFYSVGNNINRVAENVLSFGEQKAKWSQECGCANATTILARRKHPIRCACISKNYDKEWSPGGGEIATTVFNTFDTIKIVDVNEANKIISSDIKLRYRWEDGRITTTFPNNKSTLFT